MKTALIGYGRMGRGIESLLLDRGHEIVLIIDEHNRSELTCENLRKADVAIEFTTPATAFGNVIKCLECGIPVVCGTTGWNGKLDEAKRLCEELAGTFFYAPNYSLGVNIFGAVSECLARIMDRFPEYEVSVTDIHHVQKKDKPSGTAVMLAEGIIGNLSRKSSWVEGVAAKAEELGIVSLRKGEVPGTHAISYSSTADVIEIIHAANDRSGFILGAVLAAEFASRNKGVLSMKDLLKF